MTNRRIREYLKTDEGLKEVSDLKDAGLSNKQIAERLGIGTALLDKLASSNRLLNQVLAPRPQTEPEQSEEPKRMGVIYYIHTLKRFYQYVGQAIDFKGRMKEHIHGDLKIDEAIRTYGYDVSILEECPLKELDEREAYYIDLFQTYEGDGLKGLNQTRGNSNNSRYIVHYDLETFQILGIYAGISETYKALGSPRPLYMKALLEYEKYNLYGLMYLDDYIFLDSYKTRQTKEYKDWLDVIKDYGPSRQEIEKAQEEEYQAILSKQKPTYTDEGNDFPPWNQ